MRGCCGGRSYYKYTLSFSAAVRAAIKAAAVVAANELSSVGLTHGAGMPSHIRGLSCMLPRGNHLTPKLQHRNQEVSMQKYLLYTSTSALRDFELH